MKALIGFSEKEFMYLSRRKLMSSVSSIGGNSPVYQAVANNQSNTTQKSNDDKAKAKTEQAVVYEKSSASASETPKPSINRMSKEDRAKLVQQLKDDAAKRQNDFTDLVMKTIGGQAKANSLATGDDSIWKFLASGDFTVDAATKAQAQEDISENGYWGVNQTSQRLFDFASALAGDDVEKMKEMQKAMEKGFKLATKDWGQALPGISKDTLDAANKLFDDYYASKNAE